MRVLQVCPLWFPIERDAAGGIETLAAHLIEALLELGCEVSVLGAGDSRTRAELLPVVERHMKLLMGSGAALQYEFYEQHQLALAVEHARDFDIVHSHVGPAAFLLSALPELAQRVLHTLHSPVYPDMSWFRGQHPDIWLSTVSEYQARALRQHGLERCRTIHNGIAFESLHLGTVPSDELLFIGRIELSKGPDVAVRVARRLERPLTLAGPIIDRALFEREIEPHLSERIQYLGVVDHETKNALFCRAGCAILPFRGPEPFGMTAIEAMACGTPVVALANGALPEIVQPGVTGYIARSEDELLERVEQSAALDRAAVRTEAQRRFDIRTVAARYLELYREMWCGARQVLPRSSDAEAGAVALRDARSEVVR